MADPKLLWALHGVDLNLKKSCLVDPSCIPIAKGSPPNFASDIEQN